MNLKPIIKKWVLQNAIKFDGKANPGAIVGKVLQGNPELKNDMPTVMKEINEVVKEVNGMVLDEQVEELKRIAPELLEEKPKEQPIKIKPLPNVKGRVVMRVAPSPSGPLHIGHAYILALNSELCKMHDGELILRIEDTNPEGIYSKAYEMIPADAAWITENNVKKTIVQSERLGTYYDNAEKLINMGKAYICECNSEDFRTMIQKMEACPCRGLSVEEQSTRWGRMFGEYNPGEAVMRIKTDIAHKNPAMRDWPAMRINEHPHPKTGTDQRVWPLMNFSVAIDDHELGVTHTIRGKDHMDNEKRQQYIFDYMGWEAPTHLYVGRINFKGLELSSTETMKRIEYGEFEDWDDIRLPFLPALRRRGYHPDAFNMFSLDMGITENDKTVAVEEFFKTINHHNKQILDSRSNRYFFVDEPKEIEVVDAPEQYCVLPLHPDDEHRGTRKFHSKQKFYISEVDHNSLGDGNLYRLMDCINFRKDDAKFLFDSKKYEEYKGKGKKIMHWLPAEEENLHVEVLMPDNTRRVGLGEKDMKNIEEGDMVQLERFGFCRLDEKNEKGLKFWFCHK